MGILLSVLITSHNQGVLLERCVNSVLSQNLPFEYEIVISDDWSTDGTWEIAKSLEKKHTVVKAIQCNTDEFNPVNRCQRCGWNQCNAYRNSTGKYFAHIDADDFFCEGTEVLRKQVELLESHPECSCCMANNYRMDEGEETTNALLDNPHSYDNGYILPSEDYIANYWKVDHAFVYRRCAHEDPTLLFGGYYDDTLITDYHVQFGDIVCLNDAGYVYVQRKQSIWNEVVAKGDHLVLGCSALYVPSLISHWRKTIDRSIRHRGQVLSVVVWIMSNNRMEKGNWSYLNDIRIKPKLVGLLNKQLSWLDKVYLNALKWNIKILKHVSFEPLHWTYSYLMRPI